MSENEKNMSSLHYCSYVGVDYIICECGDDFASEELLKEHLKNNHINNETKEKPEENNTENAKDKQETVHYEIERVSSKNEISEIKEEQVGAEDGFTQEDAVAYEDACHYLDVDDTSYTEVIIQDTPEIEYEVSPEEVVIENYMVKEENDISIEVVMNESPEGNTELTLAQDSFPNDSQLVKKEGVEYISTEELLHNHLEENHNILNISENSTIRLCELCKKVFLTERAFIMHLKREHYEKSKPKEAKPKPRNLRTKYKTKMCEVCGKNFSSNAALTYHMRTHTGERPYICQVCNKGFTMPLLLQIHFRIHTGERPFQCHLCPKAFSNKAAINRHNRVHTGDKPYLCPECGKGFTQSNSMKLHVRTVHLRLPAPYLSKKRRRQQLERLELNREIIKMKNENEETVPVLVTNRGTNKHKAIKPSRDFIKIKNEDELCDVLLTNHTGNKHRVIKIAKSQIMNKVRIISQLPKSEIKEEEDYEEESDTDD